jgi:hypothetical protein
MAGAWYFNLTTGAIGGSDDLLDLYGEPSAGGVRLPVGEPRSHRGKNTTSRHPDC